MPPIVMNARIISACPFRARLPHAATATYRSASRSGSKSPAGCSPPAFGRPGYPGASRGQDQLLLCAAGAPSVAPLGSTSATIITPLVATCAPILSAGHTRGLGAQPRDPLGGLVHADLAVVRSCPRPRQRRRRSTAGSAATVEQASIRRTHLHYVTVVAVSIGGFLFSYFIASELSAIAPPACSERRMLMFECRSPCCERCERSRRSGCEVVERRR